MYTMTGVTVSDGVSEGEAFVMSPDVLFERFEDSGGVNISEELRKYREATRVFAGRLKRAIAGTIPDKARDIFGAVAAYITNADNTGKVERLINLGTSGADAASSVLLKKISNFYADEADPESQRISGELTALMREYIESIRNTTGAVSESMPHLNAPSVLIASDLSPARFLALNTDLVRAVVLEGGQPSGHLGTILRDLGIPAVFSAKGILTVKHGARVLVDAGHGSVLIDPPHDAAQALITRRRRFAEEDGASDGDLEVPDVTIACSMGAKSDAERLRRTLRFGLGLLRSEFLFLGCKEEPTVEHMRKVFSEVFSEVPANSPLTIRTFDFAGDKRPLFTPETDESGPLRRYGAIVGSALLKKELKAVLLAAGNRKVNITFPLITSISEVKALRSLLESVLEDLRRNDETFCEPVVGLMIETPAAVLSARGFAAYGSFFLIGTSSLAEYASAPREPSEHFTPALAKMVALACKAAFREGISVGIAGRFAMKSELLPFFMSMGVNYITTDLTSIVKIRSELQRLSDAGTCPRFDLDRYHKVMDLASSGDLNRLIFGTD